jgi:hypothetical protein
MNTPNRPHEELDADERELARVVRALPGNEPPPALDLRILKAAQDAVAATPAKRTRRALWATSSAGSLWGFGTAAAAVLAIGVSWQLFMRAPSGNFPASSPAIIAKDNAQDRDSTSVDFIAAAPKADQGIANQMASASAPASQPMPQAQRAASAAEPMRQESKQLAAPAPQPFLDEHVAEANEARARDKAESRAATTEQSSDDLRADAAAAKPVVAENAPAESAASAGGAPAAAMAFAPPPAAPPPPADAERGEESAMEKSAVATTTTANTGQLAGAAAAPVGQAEMQSKPAKIESVEEAKHRVRLDTRLYPESWILKIRSRLKNGDVVGARASLKLFVEHYPQETVPENLKPLLGE